MKTPFAIAVGLVSIVAFVHCDECAPEEQANTIAKLLKNTSALVQSLYGQAPNGELVLDYIQDICTKMQNILLRAGEKAEKRLNLPYLNQLARKLTTDVCDDGLNIAFDELADYRNLTDKPRSTILFGVFITIVKYTLETSFHCEALYPTPVMNETSEWTRWCDQYKRTIKSLKKVIPVLEASGSLFWRDQHVHMLNYCTKLFPEIDRQVMQLKYTNTRAKELKFLADIITALNIVATRNV